MRLFATFALLAALPGAAAQQQPTAPPPQPYTLRSTASLVLVPAQVQTSKGDTLYTLRADQFVLEDNGVPQRFRLDEDTDALGLSLVVVVQCSRSAIRQFDNLRGLPAMIDDLVGGAPRQVAVVSFGQEPVIEAEDERRPFTSDPDRTARNLAEVEPCDEGANATLDAVDFARKLLDGLPAAAQRHRRAILLVSETRDHGSHLRPESVVANLGRSNIVLDAVSFSPGRTELLDSLLHGRMGPGPLGLLVMAVEAMRKNVPHTLATLSGGEYFNFASRAGFDRDVHALANRIHNFYLLSFTPGAGEPGTPTPEPEPGMHHLSVRVPDYPDARIHARVTYFYGKGDPAPVPDK